MASAQAWLLLARTALELGAPTDAVAAARHGIADLGDDYRPKRVKDDTGLKLLMANDSILSGGNEDGAHALISVLEQRVELYFVRYAPEVRPAPP